MHPSAVTKPAPGQDQEVYRDPYPPPVELLRLGSPPAPHAILGGTFISASSGLLVLSTARISLLELATVFLAGVALTMLWTTLVVEYWNERAEGAPVSRRQQCKLHSSALLSGLSWGLPVLFWSGALSELQLQTYTWLVICACVFTSACMAVHLLSICCFLAGALLPLAWAWSLRDQGNEGLTFQILLAAAWGVCTYLHQRVLSFSRRSWIVAAERRSFVAALAQRNRMLEAAHRSKSRVLTTASHEIRQPIHALGLLVERLRLNPDSQHLRGQIDDISAVVQSLAQSLNLLLDMSRLEAGVVKVNRSTFRAQALLDKILAEHEIAANDKGLALHVELGNDPWIDSDVNLLYGILSNLVSNAIRYTDRGSVSVACQLRGSRVFLDVSDTGRGIPAAQHEAIFREYVRLDRENQSTQGFGLGLAIVRRTAELLGARITLDSTPGRGSRFSIVLPCVEHPPAATPQETAPLVPFTGSIGRGLVGLRGLVIDNDPVVLRGMEAMLRSWGCLPIVAIGLDELQMTLTHLGSSSIDFVVADYHLGAGHRTGMDAIELVRLACGHPVPATLLTGDLSIRSLSADGENGVAVLHKPVMPARLRAAIEAMAAAPPTAPEPGLDPGPADVSLNKPAP